MLAASVTDGPAGAPGKVIITAVPPDGWADWIHMRPPCASTSRRAMGRPSPMPARLRVDRFATRHAKKLLEHALTQRRRHAGSLVGNFNGDVQGIELDCGHADLGVLRRVLAGVVEQHVDHFRDRRGVDGDRRQVVARPRRARDAGGDGAARARRLRR